MHTDRLEDRCRIGDNESQSFEAVEKRLFMWRSPRLRLSWNEEGAHDDGTTAARGQPVYSFRLEDQIPETHLLRLIDRYVDFSFVRERLQPFYNSTGRPSIDPEVLLRLLRVGYLYGISSERRLLDELGTDASGLSLVHPAG